MKIYTKKGDTGFSWMLARPGEADSAIRKDDAKFEAVGTLDELAAVIGLSLVEARRVRDEDIVETLMAVRDELFSITSAVVSVISGLKLPSALDESVVERIEHRIDTITAELPELKSFILPGGSELSSRLHLARTVARRAERAVISAMNPSDGTAPTGTASVVLKYINRLSDLLFVLARQADRHVDQLEDAP